MQMVIDNLKLAGLVAILTLSLLGTSHGATYYAATNGAGSECSSAVPCSLDYAVETKAGNGDIVKLRDGVYSIGQLVVPAGVSLTSLSQDRSKVRLRPNTNLNTSHPLILLSSNPGGSGNQTISHLEITGINGGNRAYIGIGVRSRNNVRITECDINNFYGVIHAAAVEVRSLEVTPTDQWGEFWPADPQIAGIDTNIDALWPANPVENFQLDNSTITDCGFYGWTRTGGVTLWHLKNSSIHNNYFDNTVSRGQMISGRGCKTGLLWNVDVYKNTLKMGAVYPEKDPFMIELWVMRGGCEFYDNDFAGEHGGGFYSITVGKETKIYGNKISIEPPRTDKGIGIEFNMQSEGEVSGNEIYNSKWAVIVGFSYANTKNWITRNITVKDNYVFNNKYTNIWASCLGAQYSQSTAIVENVDIFGNYLDGQTAAERGDQLYRGTAGIKVSQSNIAGACVIRDIDINDNTIVDMTGYAGKTSGRVDDLLIDGNTFHGNTYNVWDGSTALNTSSEAPAKYVRAPTLRLVNSGQ